MMVCRNENSEVAAFMKAQGFDGPALENYYENRLLEIVGGPQVNKSYMVWQEIFNNGVHAKMDTVIDGESTFPRLPSSDLICGCARLQSGRGSTRRQ